MMNLHVHDYDGQYEVLPAVCKCFKALTSRVFGMGHFYRTCKEERTIVCLAFSPCQLPLLFAGLHPLA